MSRQSEAERLHKEYQKGWNDAIAECVRLAKKREDQYFPAYVGYEMSDHLETLALELPVC